MSYKLVSLKKIKENPDILEMDYRETWYNAWGSKKESTIKSIQIARDSTSTYLWIELNTGENLDNICKSINVISKHLKLNELYLL